eukprot:s5545_g1.t1
MPSPARRTLQGREEPASCLDQCLFRFCPSVRRGLRAMGYEQALLVRDGTHFAILFSCLVSLIFIVVWFVDLSRLQCSLTRPPDKQGPPAFGWEGVEQCTMEFVGILVFFANFRDCLRMVSNYDNERQDVLRRKAETFNNLRDHCVVALQQAQENASRLREMLFDMMETKVREHIGSVMLNLLPTLWSTACRLPEEEQQQFVATMRELLEQLSANLDAPWPPYRDSQHFG